MLESHGFDLHLAGDLKTCDLSTDQQFKDIAMHIFFQGTTQKNIFNYLKVAKQIIMKLLFL